MQKLRQLSKSRLIGCRPFHRRQFHVIPIFGAWLNDIFNKVDPSRIEAVGADVACAEWLLRNGGRVKFGHPSAGDFLADYNQLPRGKSTNGNGKYRIEEIDATESSISSVGFAHLHDLHCVKKMMLRRCRYVGDSALIQVVEHLNESLEDLEVDGCDMVTDAGIRSLVDLRQLRRLFLANLKRIEDRNGLESLLRRALPKCDINF